LAYRTDLELSVYFQICELKVYMLRNVCMSPSIAIDSFS